MSLRIEQYNGLIGAIYDSVIDPAQWTVFFERLGAVGDFQACALFVMEPAQKSLRYSSFWGTEMQEMALIEARYAEDPTMTFLHGLADPARDPDEPLVYRQAFDDAYLVHSPLYNEVARTYQFDDAIASLTLMRPDRLGFLSANRYRTKRVFGAREVQLMRLLAPHLRRAVTISDRLDMHSLETAILGSALDALADGVVLVDASMRVIHTNATARAMLDRSHPIALSDGRLVAATPKETAQLETVIATASARLVLLPDQQPMGVRGVPLSTPDGEPAIAHVLPLTTGAMRLPSNAIAAVFVTRDARTPSVLGGVGALYNLTPTEQRLAHELGLGLSLAEASAALGISENTAKTHITRIYSKTGVSRHAELVALLARLAPPLR